MVLLVYIQLPYPQISPEQAANFLYLIFYLFRNAVEYILETTVFTGHMWYAATYGDAISFMFALSIVYLIMELFSFGKRMVKTLLILSWIILFLTLLISKLLL